MDGEMARTQGSSNCPFSLSTELSVNNCGLRTNTPWAFIVSLLTKVLNSSGLKANWGTQKGKARRKDIVWMSVMSWEVERGQGKRFLRTCYPKALTLVLLTVRDFTKFMSTANKLLKTSVSSSIFTFKDWYPGEGSLFFPASCQVLHLLFCWDAFLSWVPYGLYPTIKGKDNHTALAICSSSHWIQVSVSVCPLWQVLVTIETISCLGVVQNICM